VGLVILTTLMSEQLAEPATVADRNELADQAGVELGLREQRERSARGEW
jgi:hypothetical protein